MSFSHEVSGGTLASRTSSKKYERSSIPTQGFYTTGHHAEHHFPAYLNDSGEPSWILPVRDHFTSYFQQIGNKPCRRVHVGCRRNVGDLLFLFFLFDQDNGQKQGAEARNGGRLYVCGIADRYSCYYHPHSFEFHSIVRRSRSANEQKDRQFIQGNEGTFLYLTSMIIETDYIFSPL